MTDLRPLPRRPSPVRVSIGYIAMGVAMFTFLQSSSHDLTEPPGGTMQENLSKSTPKPPPIVNPPRFLRPDVPAGPPKPKNKTMWTNRTVHVEMGGGSKEKEHRYGLGSEVRADLGRQTVRAMISDVDEDKGMYEVLYGDEGEKEKWLNMSAVVPLESFEIDEAKGTWVFPNDTLEHALELKNMGNRLYELKDFFSARQYWNKALALLTPPLQDAETILSSNHSGGANFTCAFISKIGPGDFFEIIPDHFESQERERVIQLVHQRRQAEKDLEEALKEQNKNSAEVNYEGHVLEQFQAYASGLNISKVPALDTALRQMSAAIKNQTISWSDRIGVLRERVSNLSASLAPFVTAVPEAGVSVMLGSSRGTRLRSILHMNVARASHEVFEYDTALKNAAKARILIENALKEGSPESSEAPTKHDLAKAMYSIAENQYWTDDYKSAGTTVREAVREYNFTIGVKKQLIKLRNKMELAGANMTSSERKVLLEAAMWAKEIIETHKSSNPSIAKDLLNSGPLRSIGSANASSLRDEKSLDSGPLGMSRVSQ